MNEEYQAFSDLWTRQISLLRAAWPTILLFVLLWAIPYIWVDLFYFESNAAYFFLSFASVGLNFALLFYLMDRGGHLENGARSGIVYFFLLSFVHSLGVLLGLFFLILPGIYVASRWLPCFAHLLATGEGIRAALGWSWRETQKGKWRLLKNFMGPVACFALGIGIFFVPEVLLNLPADAISEGTFMVQAIFSNLALALALAWHSLLGVAVYGSIQGTRNAIEETFE